MTGIARVYGGSLYDLAAEEQLTGSILEQMTQVRELFRENPEYLRLLSEPSIPMAERLGLIDSAFKEQAQPYLVNFIKLLCEKSYLGDFGGCCDEFTRRYNADNGIAQVQVTSAVALTKEQEEALIAKLEKVSGKKVSLSVKVDPSVVAGLRVEMDGKQLDGTVAGRMSDLSKKISEVIV